MKGSTTERTPDRINIPVINATVAYSREISSGNLPNQALWSNMINKPPFAFKWTE
jgi:hypothetical protein